MLLLVKIHPVGSIRWSSVLYPSTFYLMLEAEVVPQSLLSSLPRLRSQHVNINIYIYVTVTLIFKNVFLNYFKYNFKYRIVIG
jgi:hypothetical protein